MQHLLTRVFRFSAAHRLGNPSFDAAGNAAAFGPCVSVHGHNYRLEVTVSGPLDLQTGFCINVLDLKTLVEEHVISKLDHRFIPEVPEFSDVIPATMELLVTRMWQLLEGPLRDRGIFLVSMCLAENEDNSVRLSRDGVA
jgi:6-pyruvoyltetrahydropterin/6-carboxytetrahydropterin synthase